jgi:hypothetical protein
MLRPPSARAGTRGTTAPARAYETPRPVTAPWSASCPFTPATTDTGSGRTGDADHEDDSADGDVEIAGAAYPRGLRLRGRIDETRWGCVESRAQGGSHEVRGAWSCGIGGRHASGQRGPGRSPRGTADQVSARRGDLGPRLHGQVRGACLARPRVRENFRGRHEELAAADREDPARHGHGSGSRRGRRDAAREWGSGPNDYVPCEISGCNPRNAVSGGGLRDTAARDPTGCRAPREPRARSPR